MRRLVLLVVASLAVLTGAGPAAAQGGEAIAAYRVDVEIRADGSLRVTETIDYDFGAAQRHGILRDIPVRLRYDDRNDRLYGLDVESVSERYVEEDAGGGRHRIRIGDPDRTISGRRTYTLVYRVAGALNAFEDHDELYWNAIGADWDAPIASPVVTVRAPGTVTRVACFAGPTGSSLPCGSATIDGATARFTSPALGPREALTVVVALPKGVVVPPPAPRLEERWSLDRAFERTPATVGGALALLVAGLGAVGWVLWRSGRDRRFVGSHVEHVFGNPTGADEPVPLLADDTVPVEYEPPDGLRPGQVGTLVDERAHPLDVTATIVDLAVRGYLRVEEIEKQGWFGKPDWLLVRTKAADDGLLAYERILHGALFEGRDEVRLGDLKNTFATHLRAVQSSLYDDAVDRGWYTRRPDRVRAWWVAGGLAGVVAGGAVTALLAANTHLGLLGIPLVVAALGLLAASHWMPRRTARGTAALKRTLGFRRFIEESERDRARFAERANLFSEYLPYAVVFGATDRWARAFAGLDGELPATSWYTGGHPLSVGAFTESFGGFTTTAAGTIASTPGGSGSSGFGGGGSSGGGGGGGGGGSW